MFVLAVVRDAVRVSPAAFGKAPANALRDEIDARYGGTSVVRRGLRRLLRDREDGIRRLSSCFRWWSDLPGRVPTAGLPALRGRSTRCTVEFVDENGLRCTTGFFSQIRIPSKYLPSSSTFDPARRLYLDSKQRKIQTGDAILVRVASVKFTRLSKRKQGPGDDVGAGGRDSDAIVVRRLICAHPVPSAMEVVAPFVLLLVSGPSAGGGRRSDACFCVFLSSPGGRQRNRPSPAS